jgi:hypothetical protein
VIIRKTFLLFAISLFAVPCAFTATEATDTLRLFEGSRLRIGDERIRIRKDTTLILEPGTEYRIWHPRGNSGQVFFDSLEERASRKAWTRRLHNIVVREPRRLSPEDTVQTRLSTDPFRAYAGKSIRSVSFDKLKPFGTSLYSSTPRPPSRMEKFGNDLHRITQDQVFRKYLLFSEGDFVDPNEFADNERLIRRLPFIQNAYIRIEEVSPGSDSVDVTIVSKDAFFLGLGGEILDYTAGNLKVFDPNLFGRGHELHAVFHWNGEKEPWLGNELHYIINNLGGSFIDTRMGYTHVFETESYDLELERKFFTPDIKYAGALDLERTQTRRNIGFPDTIDDPVPVKYNNIDGWIGRSFQLARQNNVTGSRTNLVLATRLYHGYYIRRPEVTATSLYEYQNKTGWLSSLSLSSQSFFKTNLIRDFGRPEDIPQGMLVSLTMGPEFNEFNTRIYAGFSFSQGRYLGNFGYLFTRIDGGGFLERKNFVDQGVINLKLDYFSNLFVINRFKVRHFISGSYVRGIRRFEDEFIDLRDENGIRGFRAREVTGTQKLAINYEATAFTPYYLYGFRFVLFGFVDAGIIGPDIEPLDAGDFFSGYGFGLRIRNERLVFETITIRLGFYPDHPGLDLPLLVNVAGRDKLNPENFRVRKPRFAGFK